MDESKIGHYAERINRVCEYIYQHLEEDLSVERLSQVACFSKFHFHRQFSEYTGVTVTRFIQLMRLKRASYRLAIYKQERIIDIALDAQFENPESFTRAFKNTFGQTPSQFRSKPEWPEWHTRFQFSVPIHMGEQTMDVKIIDFDETQVALLEHRDAPDRVMESAGKFVEWRKQTGLSPVRSSMTFGIAYDDPKTTPADQFRFDICGSITQDVPENPQGVKMGVIPGGRCAVMRHKGSHDEIGKSVHYLYGEWLPQSKEELRDYPCFFHYLNLIYDTPEHELETDIYLPLK